MAQRAALKAAARAAREARAHERQRSAARRRRLTIAGAATAVAVAALVLAIVVSSGGGRAGLQLSPATRAADTRVVGAELAGIPQSGNVLGRASAPVTITEYGDLVCPICRDFAVTTEPGIISALVTTGQARLVYRGLETASLTANASEYIATQVDARSAGLQRREWNFVLLAYREQPQSIGGSPAETFPYVTPTYLRDLAAQIPGLDLSEWRGHAADRALAAEVADDRRAALAAGIDGTPTILVAGPRGSVEYDRSQTLGAIPSVAQIEQLIAQVR